MALWAEPRIQFPLAACQRRAEHGSEAERAIQSLLREGATDAWREAAIAEQWLARGRGREPQEVWKVAAAAEKPRLDGVLDEPLWSDARRVELASTLGDDGDWPAAVRLACDGQFLYFAVECRKAPGVKYPASTGPRTRDADLSAGDRIELLLDVDRDRATYYRLAVDHRGWTSESCFGNSSWNPSWYVAAHADEGTWTAEAALPLAELVAEPPRSGEAWCIGVQRVAPGVGFQSCSRPASTAIEPAGFGLLVFP
jgi:hypothetical protein